MPNEDALTKLSNKASAIITLLGPNGLIDIVKDTSELYDILHLTKEEEQEFADLNFDGDLEYFRKVRLIRTVYLISKMVDNNYKTFKKIHRKYSRLWKDMESQVN